MGLQDLIVTPAYLILFYAIALILKPYVTDKKTQGFYLLGLTIKFLGAIGLGLIYQYYYNGGDTYNYYYWGSKWVWEAFLDSPVLAFKIIFGQSGFDPETYKYTSHMVFYGSGGADFVSKLAGLFSLITFNTYSTIALFFALYSFVGSWWFFSAISKIYPELTNRFGLAVFFLPSVLIWGSGLLKDTLMLSAVLFVYGSVIRTFYLRGNRLLNILIVLVSFYLIYRVKIYILLCLLPGLLMFLFVRFNSRIRSRILRWSLVPILGVIIVYGGYLAVDFVSSDNSKYNLNKIAQTASATAWWHDHISEQVGGSNYSFGDYDYSASGVLRKIFPAINVTLFRPYIWEARSAFMLLSALESFFFLILTISLLVKLKLRFSKIFEDHLVLTMLIFSLMFAFSVGAVTYNFGALVRYKIPILPIYVILLLILNNNLRLFQVPKNHASRTLGSWRN